MQAESVGCCRARGVHVEILDELTPIFTQMFHLYALEQLRGEIDACRDDVVRLLRAAIGYLVRSGRMWIAKGSIVVTHSYHAGHSRWTARVFLPGQTGAYVGGIHIYQKHLGLYRRANATFREVERDAAESIWRNRTFGGRCVHTAYLICNIIFFLSLNFQ
ncbi:hypothetical protein HYPSUDRAFT_59344 [Hypholoma sublateritium FD-334 SS-4]|uniref:Uncharacterized protein n=1 Tax=Hypholoma sublateritium (strain FD-334 SS-4) TaxID=945553 RepID=A0A0D2KIK1_HYPSF|nr:hypothetical protein HYPSUDRAFT_59344 [Hypholoma sublateritium FD-334 SS-4]